MISMNDDIVLDKYEITMNVNCIFYSFHLVHRMIEKVFKRIYGNFYSCL